MIIANLATYPPRRALLDKVVSAISPQVDRLNIVLNQYNEVPRELLNYGNVVPHIPDEDLKDVGKFFPDTRRARLVFLLDDDIMYPPDYVEESIKRLDVINMPNCMGGYHASLYTKPGISYILKHPRLWLGWRNRIADFRLPFNFNAALERATIVDQIGSGTAILRGEHMPPYGFMAGSQKFVDVRLARWCCERGITPICLPRKDKWLGQHEVEEAIYTNFTTQHPKHVSAEIMAFAFKGAQRGAII